MNSKFNIPGPLGQSLYKRKLGNFLRHFAPLSRLLGTILPRLFDVSISLFLLIILLPILILRAFISKWQTGQILIRTPLIGRYQVIFQKLAFAGKGPGCKLAVLLNILCGDIAFAGPRPLSQQEVGQVPVDALIRFSIRPGLISPYKLHQGIGIAYETETMTDKAFVYDETLKSNAGLVARSIVINMLGDSTPKPAPPSLNFFNIAIINTTMDEATDWIIEKAQSSDKSLLAFVNPDCLNIAYTHSEYSQILQHATRVLPDGIGIHIGCRMLGLSLKANVNGTDLFPRLCKKIAAQDLSLFLLGGQPEIAEAVAKNMQKSYPQLRIAGTQDGYFSESEEQTVIEKINASGANILLVAFGVPKQEIWINNHRTNLKIPICMGVGGLFDFYSGRIPRAPLWLREIGLEWTWRLIQEPGRLWRRYLIGNPLFLYRVWKQARS